MLSTGTNETLAQLATGVVVLVGAILSALNRRAIAKNTQITQATHDLTNGRYMLLLHEVAHLKRERATRTQQQEHIEEAVAAEKELSNRIDALDDALRTRSKC